MLLIDPIPQTTKEILELAHRTRIEELRARRINKIDFAKPFLFLFTPARHKAMHGGRGGGKSWHAALALLEKARQEKLRILCVREIQLTIRDSVHKLLKDFIELYGMTDYEVTERTIRNTITGSEFIFKGMRHNVNEIKSFEGIDICWVEEAQAVSQDSLDILIPTIRKPGSEIWYTFNRMFLNDPVWKTICANPDDETIVLKINMFDLPEEMQSSVLQREAAKLKAVDPDRYRHIWLGEPVGQEANAILETAQVTTAMERRLDPFGDLVWIGADIARFGKDRVVFFARKGNTILKYRIIEGKIPINETVTQLQDFTDEYIKVHLRINIDDTGLGGGVSDYMTEAKYHVNRVNFGFKGKQYLKEPDKYYNVISEMWFNFRDRLPQIDIPEDDELRDELTDRLFTYHQDTHIRIENKEDYKTRTKRKSPDLADALLLAFYRPKNAGQKAGVFISNDFY